MHRKNLRLACVALATAAALTGLAACGDNDGDSEGKSPFQKGTQTENADTGTTGGGTEETSGDPSAMSAALQRIEERTGAQESAKVSGSQTVGTQKMTMDGAIKWTDGLVGNLTIQQEGGQVPPGSDGKMLARYTPDTMYVNMGPAAASQFGGKSWLKYDYADLAQLAGGSGAVLKDQLQNQNPTNSVRMLLASPDVRKVGTEQIGAETTTHYSGTIDVAKFTEQASKDVTPEELAQFKDQLEAAGITTEQIDLWVNEDDLLVKKVEKADTANGAMEFVANYSDYGVDVQVEVPPESETLDFQEAMGR